MTSSYVRRSEAEFNPNPSRFDTADSAMIILPVRLTRQEHKLSDEVVDRLFVALLPGLLSADLISNSTWERAWRVAKRTSYSFLFSIGRFNNAPSALLDNRSTSHPAHSWDGTR
jgi:hypothetical protein